MGAPGEQAAFHQRQLALGGQHPVFRHGGAGAGRRPGPDEHLILGGVLEKIVFQPPLFRLRPAPHGAEIVFFDLPVADFLVEDAQCLGVFRGDDEAACVAVDAVAQSRGEGIFLSGPPFALLGEIGLDVGDEGVVIPRPRGMAQHPGLLVRQQDVPVLVHHGQAGGAHLEVRIFLPGFLEKLVVDVKLQRVPGGQASVAPGALAVELDAFQTDIFLQKGLGQQRHGLADKPVKALARVVGSDDDFFHEAEYTLFILY